MKQVKVFLQAKVTELLKINPLFENLRAKGIFFIRVTITSDENLVIIGVKQIVQCQYCYRNVYDEICKCWWKYLVKYYADE